jgi:hypothetical protein
MSTETITPAVNEPNEVAIKAAADNIIRAAAAKNGLTIDQIPQEAREDALRFARASFEENAKKEADPYYKMYCEEKAAHYLTKNQLGAISQSRNAAATSANHKAPILAEVAQAQAGNQWYTLSDSQKAQSVGWAEPIDRDELYRLFAVGADSHTVVDYQRSNGQRFARLRELAKVLHIYGAKRK